ncbi:MAG: M28 family peptidase [Candidatus Krumholzibacteriota bacterium]|nr:M28 family peptidase [Candidatus Krumholzibacteriota bacterium]
MKGFILNYSHAGLKALLLSIVVIPVAISGSLHSQTCQVCDLIDKVNPFSIEGTVRAISGEDSVNIDGMMTLIKTRYTFSDQKTTAMKYLMKVASDLGYQPWTEEFILTIDTPDLTGIDISSGMDTVWAGSIEGNIFRATASDGWTAFELISSVGGRVIELVNSPGGRLFAACKTIGSGYGRIFTSTDGGVTWILSYDGNNQNVYALNTITFWNEDFGFAAGDAGSFLYTADGGESWFSEVDPSEFGYRSINGSSATGPFHFWVVTTGGYLYESENFGRTWMPVYQASAWVNDVDFFNADRGIIVGNKVTCYTTDGGENWTETVVDADLRCVVMVDSVKAIASGGGGDIWISEDGGATWTGTGVECTGETDVWRIAVSDSGTIWGAGRDEVVRVATDEYLPPDCSIYAFSDTIFGKNIIFRREGETLPGNRIIICGHYDSINRSTDPFVCAPGADDNGSGVASVMECARLLADARLEKTVEFILFDGEELGLMGSVAFARDLDPSVTYEGVFNIDMAGNDYAGNSTISVAGYDGTADTVLVDLLMRSSESYNRIYSLDWGFRGSHQPASDNLAFKEIDEIPAVLIIETGYFENPHYHNCTDLVDFMDFNYVADVVRSVLGAAVSLAGLRSVPLAEQVVLYQNYPNPFFSSTSIPFELPESLPVELSIFDVSGRRVARLINERLGPDRIVYQWDGRNETGETVASGLYFIRLEAGPYTKVKKTVILR